MERFLLHNGLSSCCCLTQLPICFGFMHH